MDLDDDNFYYLDQQGLPQVRLYPDGSMFDERKNIEIYPQPKSNYLQMVSPVTHKLVNLSYERTYGAYYRAPWMQDPPVDSRSLAPVGFSNYHATRDGRIFSTFTNDYLIGNFSFDGYLRVLVKRDVGEYATIGIHRLVAMVYVPNPENKPEVNHIDGNKLNNCADNLEWVMGWENVHHALNHGLRKSVLDDPTIHEICRRLERGDTVKSIMMDLGVSKHSVLGIKSGCHYRISKNYNIPRNRHF